MLSKIYKGKVVHGRFTPINHSFEYSLFCMYLDLDELPQIFTLNPLWSMEKLNFVTYKRNHYHRPEIKDLKQAVQTTIFEKTGVHINGPVRMLTHLQYFGYCMNPVTFYYCFEENSDNPRFVMSEIENTPWGERFQYIHEFQKTNNKFEKEFHVSPFFPMNITYHWSFSAPNEKLKINMNSFQENKLVFNANLNLEAFPITADSLSKIILEFPLMTLKVIGGIYIQALILWLKKVPFFSHPNTNSQKSFLIFKGDQK